MPVLKCLGHSCFTLSTEKHSIIFDPFLTGNPLAASRADEVQVDAILPSHGHSDHLGDTVAIATRLGCPVVTAFELCMYCARFGCEVAPMHVGGSRSFEWGKVKLTPALHGSAVVGDTIEYTGLAVGFLVTMAGVTVYFAGDTGLFGDMKLIGDAGVDVAILPIGDCFTMGPDDALLAIDFLRPSLVVPMHYNTFDAIGQDAAAFAARLSERGVTCEVLAPGRQIELPPR
jgi:L-ascorbate metabolism protein UlaG (beta-lactamase superfamily)